MAGIKVTMLKSVENLVRPFSQYFNVDYVDENGVPYSHDIHCIGVTYKGKVIREPHSFYREKMAPVGGSGICEDCQRIIRDIKNYTKSLMSFWKE
ncbi:MAG: hypothetical protein QXN71_01315 [Candidatus Aenigmatarchaeota archaeon]